MLIMLRDLDLENVAEMLENIPNGILDLNVQGTLIVAFIVARERKLVRNVGN